jgi:hypothetical protein
MLLQEFFDRVLLSSGEFILSPDALEVKWKEFSILVQQTLGVYNHHDPVVRKITKNIESSRSYEFTEINTLEGIPEFISEIIPIRISGVYPFMLREYDKPKTALDVKTEFPWEYRKPTLYIPIQGQYDMTCVYNHKLKQTTDLRLWECSTIDDSHDEFFRLLTAKFLRAIALSRRAFTMGDLPIASDASELAGDAKEMEKDALESIQTNKSQFYLAWR